MTTKFGRLMMVLAVMLVLSGPGLSLAADSGSDTGQISVEVLPPGSVPAPTPGPNAPGVPPADTQAPAQPTYGTVTPFIMWLPDPAIGQTTIYGLLTVQDHRANADGWTVRLMNTSAGELTLVRVVVGDESFGLPAWVYMGIHAWDVAVGAPLAESPQMITAPQGRGYSLTIHQFWLVPGSAVVPEPGTMQTFVLILPFAP